MGPYRYMGTVSYTDGTVAQLSAHTLRGDTKGVRLTQIQDVVLAGRERCDPSAQPEPSHRAGARGLPRQRSRMVRCSIQI
jgi:hypothetical protein